MPAQYMSYPYSLNTDGRTARVDYEQHVRQQIEQILFTSPGERPNRPTFGCGLNQLIFAPNSDLLAQSVQATIQAALQQWLGDRIQLVGVETKREDSAFFVSVAYRLTGSEEERVETFSKPI